MVTCCQNHVIVGEILESKQGKEGKVFKWVVDGIKVLLTSEQRWPEFIVVKAGSRDDAIDTQLLLNLSIEPSSS